MNRSHPLEAKLAAVWPLSRWADVTVVVAVSGGADSVALLRALKALRTGGAGQLAVAHFNHQLRGQESDEDEAFVLGLCGQLNLPCQVGRAAEGHPLCDQGDGLEAAARQARYDFLGRAAARLGARFVVTAHTADDQAETILHRILRGTGIAGLSGMARARPIWLPLREDGAPWGQVTSAGETTPVGSPPPSAGLIRPLLGVRHAELVAYLDDLGQPYRCDPSNAERCHTRNRIRHELLPWLAREFNSGVLDAVLRLGTLAAEVQAVVEAVVDDLLPRCVRLQDTHLVEIDAGPLCDQPRYVVRELLMAVWRGQGWPLQAMGFGQWDLLAGMATGEADDPAGSRSKQIFPGGVSVERFAGGLRLERPGR